MMIFTVIIWLFLRNSYPVNDCVTSVTFEPRTAYESSNDTLRPMSLEEDNDYIDKALMVNERAPLEFKDYRRFADRLRRSLGKDKFAPATEKIPFLLVVYPFSDTTKRLQIGFRADTVYNDQYERDMTLTSLFLFVPSLNRFIPIDRWHVHGVMDYISEVPGNFLELKTNDLGINYRMEEPEAEPAEFWTDWGQDTRDRRRGGKIELSDREYQSHIDPACVKRISPLLERLRRQFGEVVLLDIFSGRGDFVEMLYNQSHTEFTPYLIERDAGNAANARVLLSRRNCTVIQAALGEGKPEVIARLPRRPNLATSIGGINTHVATRRDAFAVAGQVSDTLPIGGIFVVTGLSLCHLDRDDFELLGFKAEQMTMPENIFKSNPDQFYVLVKTETRKDKPILNLNPSLDSI